MSAFDTVTRIIHDDTWDDGEEVEIREPTYGESMKMAKSCTDKNGELDGMKYSDMLLPLVIVSWTFKKDDKEVTVTLDNIRELPTSYVTFIAEEVGEFSAKTDADFPAEA